MFSALACLALASGCLDKVPDEKVPGLQTVTGTVTLDGQPAPNVAVVFMPAPGSTGNGANGSTDASGKYSLVYRTGDAGIPAGEYVVVFSKMVQPDGSPIPEGQTAADVMAVDAIPERYRDASDKPLHRVTVPEGGATLDFDLNSK